MKKLFMVVALFAGLQFVSSNGTAQQIFVQVRPQAPMVVRPPRPRPEHIWVEGEWIWRGGRYEYVNGYWAPPRPGFHYVPGFWRHTRRGEVWIPGGWRR